MPDVRCIHLGPAALGANLKGAWYMEIHLRSYTDF